MARYFVDTEFIEDGRTIDVLSIGVVSHSDNRQLYLVNAEADLSRANDFVKEHVIPHLMAVKYEPGLFVKHCPRAEMRDLVLEFLNYGGHKPRVWAYYADYDWVALCQLFGRMVDLPKHWPMFAYDLKMLLDMAGNPRIQVKNEQPHHALYDARWERDVFEWLKRSVHPAAHQELFRHL